MEPTGDERTDDRGHPEEPELFQGPGAGDRAGAVLRAGFMEVFVTGNV
jgi:hypothetical protein